MIEIKDKFHKITITLTTYLKNKNNLYLSVYKLNHLGNDVLLQHHYVPVIDGDKCTFVIKFSDEWFEVGDIISKILVGITGEYNLYDLQEGISVTVDGSESNVELVVGGIVQYDDNDNPIMVKKVTNPQFALQFTDAEEHRVRAVYKGNKEIGVGISDEIILQAIQRDTDDPLSPAGKYVVTFVKYVTKMKYLEKNTFQFRLTKGGVGVPGRTLELVLPYGEGAYNTVQTRDTDSNGYVTYNAAESVLKKWTPGTWKIGARFYNYDDDNNNKIITSTFKNLTIEKADVKIGFKAAGKKGKQARFTVKNPLGTPMEKVKLTIKVGSKKYVKTTDAKGHAYLTINNKGHFKYAITYAGDSNYKKQTKNVEETITE